MNSKRGISNITKKVGYEDMYNIHYFISGTNSLVTKTESVHYKNGILTWDKGGLKLISKRLRSTQREIVEYVRTKLKKFI